MAVSHIANSGNGDGYAANEVVVGLTISSGSDRLLFASCHARGNANEADLQWVRIYSGYQNSGDRGTLIASLTSVLDIEADAILHAEYFILKEADMPSNGYYQLVANANESGSGAFQTALGWFLFGGVDQTASPDDGYAYNSGGSSISQSITPSESAGVIVDNWSGDGGNPTWSPGNYPRDGYCIDQQVSTALGARAAYAIVSTGGSKTFSWSGGFQNRNALGIVFFPESGAGPAPGGGGFLWHNF